ncbi:MAG TPA: DUF1501 domain-containing protein [Gemmataceae bacterium]|nr:DUF1501 domain-containing protein [Gemmataceae bacterium]
MSAADYPEMNRRHFLRHLAGMAGLTLPAMQFIHTLRAAEPQLKKQNKSLIILWMGGGPSHLDLWDLKPGQPTGGEFKPIKTSADGIEISELLPTVAEQMKHLSIIRSLHSGEADHNRGTLVMNTGRTPNPVVQYPAMGAVASSLLTSKELALPGFIGIGGTAQRIGPGFLGNAFAPFTVQNPGQPPANIRPPQGLGPEDPSGRLSVELEERLRRRQRLFYTLEDHFSETLFPHLPEKEREKTDESSGAHRATYEKAFRLTVSTLRAVFEVRNEPLKVREMYGGDRNSFGMGCLLARRLVEKGVTCVEVDLGGWDNHNNIFPALRNGNGPRLDKGMGALVQDLVDRGMWQNTVVLWMGDFGRTPRINPNAGRDHWARGWSVVLGGGAIKGGYVHGATTADGMDIKDGRVGVGDLFATVYKGLGLEPDTKIRDNLGRPLPIADGKPIPGLV